MSDFIVDARDVHKRFGRNEVLKGVSLTVRAGEYVALMGSSGSGKTTLMNLLGCLDRPTSGKFWLEGQEMSRLSPDQRARVRSERIGFVFQNYNLLPAYDAVTNVAMPLLFSSMPPVEARQRAVRHRKWYPIEPGLRRAVVTRTGADRGAEPDAVQSFTKLRVALAPDDMAHPGARHQVTLVGRVDEHASGEPAAALHADRHDPPGPLLDASRSEVEPLAEDDLVDVEHHDDDHHGRPDHHDRGGLHDLGAVITAPVEQAPRG